MKGTLRIVRRKVCGTVILFPPAFRVLDNADTLQIITSNVHLTYNKQKFSRNGLKISLLGNVSNYHSVWHYGDEIEGLRGTARTLDHANGAIPLEAGLLSKDRFPSLMTTARC